MALPRFAVSLEDLQALNEEIRALARAGVPLERGLRAVREELPGSLGQLAERISSRMERGESLVTVLQDDRLALPPIYSALVAAGVRSGRLPAALESLTQSVEKAAELRRTLIVSAIYPIIVLMIATVLFLFTWHNLFPVMQTILPSMLDRDMPRWFQWLTWTVNQGGIWLLLLWTGVIFTAGFWLIRSRQALHFGGSSIRWPSVATVNALGRSATFAEALALMLEHAVPLPEALRLAAAATNDRQIILAAETLAERVTAGGRGGSTPRGLPPLLSWLILTHAPTAQLVRSLRQTAASFRERAHRICIFLAVYLPIFFAASMGAVVAVYYAILVLTPFYYLMFQLGQP